MSHQSQHIKIETAYKRALKALIRLIGPDQTQLGSQPHQPWVCLSRAPDPCYPYQAQSWLCVAYLHFWHHLRVVSSPQTRSMSQTCAAPSLEAVDRPAGLCPSNSHSGDIPVRNHFNTEQIVKYKNDLVICSKHFFMAWNSSRYSKHCKLQIIGYNHSRARLWNKSKVMTVNLDLNSDVEF